MNKVLYGLYLKENSIGNTGTTALTESFMSNTSIKILDFENSNVKDNGIKALAYTLCTNKSLTDIYLGSNYYIFWCSYINYQYVMTYIG